MKRRIILLAASALALVSCGSAKQFADASQNQQFRDEVYYNPKGSGADDCKGRRGLAGEENEGIPDIHEKRGKSRYPVHP